MKDGADAQPWPLGWLLQASRRHLTGMEELVGSGTAVGAQRREPAPGRVLPVLGTYTHSLEAVPYNLCFCVLDCHVAAVIPCCGEAVRWAHVD